MNRLKWYAGLCRASFQSLYRTYNGCFVCGLLPEEKGLSKGGIVCAQCGKRS